ncbi:hypothetical protein QV65_13825 [Rhodococcus erythropolis]|nr:hypothetical protein QV65_13825 [Rhodococcus erythropolis]
MSSEVDTIDDRDVVDPNAGPCTEEEARQLVREVAEAAVRFEDAMQQIFRRRAWEPLGYDNPQDLILGEFKDGGLTNPRTGKPYGRARIYRMARTARFFHEVASRAGVDATGLVDRVDDLHRAGSEPDDRGKVRCPREVSSFRVTHDDLGDVPAPQGQKQDDVEAHRGVGRDTRFPGEELAGGESTEMQRICRGSNLRTTTM